MKKGNSIKLKIAVIISIIITDGVGPDDRCDSYGFGVA